MMAKLQGKLPPLSKVLPMLLSYGASGGSLLTSAAAQLLTFAILARFLGVDEFSRFVALTAACAVAVNLCGLGTNECLVRRVARERAIYPVMLGHSLILIGATGLLLIALGTLILPFLFTVSADPAANVLQIALMLCTNILLLKLILLTEQIFISFSDFATANKLVVGFALIRTAAAVLACIVFDVSTLSGWIIWQFAAHAIYFCVCVALLSRHARPKFTLVREELPLGIYFSIPFILLALRQNADLLVLSLVAGAEIVASYSVARRILDSSHLAVDAMNRILYPGTARASAAGLHFANARVKRILMAALAIGFCAATTVYLCAPVLPLLFGEEYISLIGFVRIMCWLAIPVACWMTAVEALGASGNQGERAAVLGTGSLIGAAIAAFASWYAPPTGILVAGYIIETGMAVAAWSVYRLVIEKSRRTSAAAIGGAA